MARTDNDTWDITESVGATALGVAAGRAAENAREDRLFDDPYAQLFLDAAGEGMWTIFSRGTLPEALAAVDPQLPARMQAMGNYTASRTVFFDEFFLQAADAGVRQAVILAAGLDARAWRLPWPQGTTVYELDQPKVLEFKLATLRAAGAQPRATQVNVAIDLRQDWPEALRQAGFDASMPTAWSAEGLLPYLPAEAQDLLFERVQELSAPGSRIAVEAFGSGMFDSDSLARQRAMMQRYRDAAAQQSTALPDVEDLADLFYTDDRADVGDWLRGHGWDVEVTTAHDLMADNNRPVPQDLEDPTPPSHFIAAKRIA
jgi:methyltransferase (TIGR00027 family)